MLAIGLELKGPILWIACFLLAAFFVPLLAGAVGPNFFRLFFVRKGQKHALTGLCYLLWLVLGFGDAIWPSLSGSAAVRHFYYDVILGCLGTVLTLSAAYGFNHQRIQNVASGTLDEHATVTHAEMIEHSFYQLLNLAQVVFLHGTAYLFASDTSSSSPTIDRKLLGLALALVPTALWLVRDRFPVHPFSANYVKIDERSTVLVRLLYRLKKYQYVFYKHFMLHGLNLSVAYNLDAQLVNQQYFRLYWLSLNAAYVLEFFLQTLVKRGYLKQQSMLTLQKIFMLETTIVAVFVLQSVNILIAVASLVLNFLWRKHDFLNTVIIASVLIVFSHVAATP